MSTIIGSGLESYLHRQARERALNSIAEAREQAENLLNQARAEVEDGQRMVERQIARTVAERRRQALARARLAAQQEFTQRREEFIANVWQQVEQRLHEYVEAGPEVRRALLDRLVKDAAEQLSGGPLEIQVNARDAALVDHDTLEGWLQHLREACAVTSIALRPEPADILGGVVVFRSDVDELVDNSLDERLALAKRAIRNDIIALLEGRRLDNVAHQRSETIG